MPGWLIVVLVAGVAVLGLLLLSRRDKARRVGFSVNEKAREHWRTEHRDRGQEAAREEDEHRDRGQEAAREEETSPLDRLPPETREDVADFLRRGQKIRAIKLVREATGLGLKDAKDFVEEAEKNIGRGRGWE